ncbi:MAG: hypothetical protein EA406_03395 [Rhodospirillales bacterium]|nr:MAG: hypothetical protein EA406_03395 [Rhodospirillales bacterium]
MTIRFIGGRGRLAGIAVAVVLAGGLVLAAPAAAQQTGGAEGSATARLFEAVQANDIAAAQASIAAGASLTARDRWGLTAIDVAIDKRHFDLAHFLLSVQERERDAAAAAERPARQPRPQAARTPAGGATPANRPAAPSAMAPAGAAGGAAVTWSVTPWPAGRPNPFDPSIPAPGARLPTGG